MDNIVPRKFTEEHKQHLSEAQKGKARWTDEDKARMSESRKGRKLTDEQKAKRKKFKMSEETKARMSASRKGRVVSEETRAKISASEKGKHVSDATRARIAVSRKDVYIKGHPLTEEAKASVSEANRKRWANASEDEKRSHLDKLHKGASDITDSWVENYYAEKLDEQGIIYERQKRIGWYRVDFYIASTNEIIEICGCYWHCCEQCGFAESHKGKSKRDEKRYAYLRSKGFKVTAVWEHDLPRKPWKRKPISQ